MLFKKVALVTALFTCAAVQADTAPSYRYVQGSVERISQSGEDNFSDTGWGFNAAWQFNNNWFIATEWQRYSDSESFTASNGNERATGSTKLTLDRYYVGGGYIKPISEKTNISFAGYFGGYRLAAKSDFQIYVNEQLSFAESFSGSSTENSVKTEVVLRSNINEKLELSAQVHYEYLNADLENKSQYGFGVGAQYRFTPAFALTSELSYGKLLDENTSHFSLGARYYF
ncbi:outer membrane beta-barrel protein [Arsukibacterium indicum]|uniref:Porin family protein n=1 Tax=Arsukibacterium indicum TaxID=2848612 RepID=A0ABS6MM21_9GAMM|nr:outer membrane beta-barrel protein [Arsukibacterium indicum]MBV2129332.1 porin family protein [Arsukibacterium indicum]